MFSTNFHFGGISNVDYGIYLVRTSNNMVSSPYVPAREIKEDFPFNARQPFHYGVQDQPQTIVLTFSSLENDMDSDKLTSITNWLFSNEYKEFYSDDNTNKIYYLISIGETPLISTVNNEGYIEVRFRSKFPYALTTASTPTYDSLYDYYQILPVTKFTINNACNVFEYFYPVYEITIGATPTEIYLYNWETEQEVLFDELQSGEVLYVDNQKKTIISSTSNYKYDSFNREWFKFIQGDNLIEIGGVCTIEFSLQYPVFT